MRTSFGDPLSYHWQGGRSIQSPLSQEGSFEPSEGFHPPPRHGAWVPLPSSNMPPPDPSPQPMPSQP